MRLRVVEVTSAQTPDTWYFVQYRAWYQWSWREYGTYESFNAAAAAFDRLKRVGVGLKVKPILETWI